jgi:hypothetical protein
MECPSTSEMARRFERLERRVHRLKWAGIACTLALALALAVAAVAGNWGEARKIIRAGTFLVVDDEGREVIRISSTPQEKGQGLIEVLDKSGKPRIKMGLTASDMAYHVLIGQDPSDQLILDAIPKGGVAIRLKDLQHDSGILLTTSPEGIAGIGIMSPGKKLIFDMGVNPDATSRLIIRDAEGKELVRLPKQ